MSTTRRAPKEYYDLDYSPESDLRYILVFGLYVLLVVSFLYGIVLPTFITMISIYVGTWICCFPCCCCYQFVIKKPKSTSSMGFQTDYDYPF